MKSKGSAPAREIAGVDAWEVPGLVGAEIAHQLAPAVALMQRLKAEGAITDAESHALTDVAERLQRVAVTSQQISRLANNRMRQSHERLDLSEVVRHVIEENDKRFQRRGIEVEQRLQSIEVITDPGLLVTLCEVALECAATDGERMQVWLSMMHWPEHALLTIRARPHFRSAEDLAASNALEWIYLCRLADATGVTIRREAEGEFVQLTVEFPRTVKQLAGLTAMEVDNGGSEASDTITLAGHHVLLISANAEITWEISAIARQMRLLLDIVPDCRQAERFCELEMPHMIIIDEMCRDAVFEQLRKDILRYNINFPLLEIVAAPNVIELGTWHGGASSRLSRNEIRAQLQPLIAMELAKAF
jgi:hypothetical protein